MIGPADDHFAVASDRHSVRPRTITGECVSTPRWHYAAQKAKAGCAPSSATLHTHLSLRPGAHYGTRGHTEKAGACPAATRQHQLRCGNRWSGRDKRASVLDGSAR